MGFIPYKNAFQQLVPELRKLRSAPFRAGLVFYCCAESYYRTCKRFTVSIMICGGLDRFGSWLYRH
jgi:hypothetical protein